jgi:hypothetical protein
MSYKEKYEKYKLKYIQLKEQIAGAYTKLHFIDRYVTIRKANKSIDSVIMFLTTNPNINFESRKIGNKSGFNTMNFANQDIQYYYISRCFNEKQFNKKMLDGRFISDLSLPVVYPTLKTLTDKLKKLYTDLITLDNKYYFYEIAFNDHTFLVLKHNNNYRILQSWMLKYQLENNIFDDDKFYAIPKFITLLFIYVQYRCNFTIATKKADYAKLVNTIKDTFDCNNLQAKQYLEEFRILYRYYFSKELHILPNTLTFDLNLEINSEDYLCPKFSKRDMNIHKYEFNPDTVLGRYLNQVKSMKTIIRTQARARDINKAYISKMGIVYPYYDIKNNVNVPQNILNIIKNDYSYISRDYNYDTIMLSYLFQKYLIIKNPALNNISTLTGVKLRRDINLIRLINSSIVNKDKAITKIYRFNGLSQIAGNGTDVLPLPSSDLIKLPEIIKEKKLEPSQQELIDRGKIEYLKEYQIFLNEVMSNITIISKKITDDSLLESFNSTNLVDKMDPSDITELQAEYQIIKTQLKEKLIQNTINSIKLYFNQISTNLQFLIVIKLLLESTVLQDNMCDIIRERKMDFFEFIQQFTQTVFIADFGKFGLKKREELVDKFDLIGYLMTNQTQINQLISQVPASKMNGMENIYSQLDEINNVEQNNISNNVIPQIMQLISSKTDIDKTKTIMSLIIHGGTQCKKYFNGLLDNEIFFFGKEKNVIEA